MIERVIANCAAAPDRVTADSGYFSEDNIRACEERGTDPYIAVGRENKDGDAAANDADEEPTTAAQVAKQRRRQKLQTKTGRAIYASRKSIAEPPFGRSRRRGDSGDSRFADSPRRAPNGLSSA